MKRKWIFVTGGSRGIGAEIVSSASRNYDVVFTYKSSMIEAKALAEQLNNEPGKRVEAVHCDVSDVSQIEDVAQSLIQRYGPPYAVINNAGVAEDRLFSNLDEQALTHIFSQNVFSAFSVSRAFIGSMMGESDACIINISSVSGIKGNVGQSAYSATKAALIGMTRSLALEMSRFNMRVNSIAPGYIETDMTRHLKDNGAGLKKSIPLRRFGSTVEVASLVDYLLSEGAAYITGQTLVIDGGLTC